MTKNYIDRSILILIKEKDQKALQIEAIGSKQGAAMIGAYHETITWTNTTI